MSDPSKPGMQESGAESPFKGKTGFRRILNATRYSLAGFRSAFRHEDAFRQETIMLMFGIPLALFLQHDAVPRALMIGALFLILIVELVNSAIEAVVDRVSLENHHLAKRAKDIGSAAVMLSLANALVIWGLILLA